MSKQDKKDKKAKKGKAPLPEKHFPADPAHFTFDAGVAAVFDDMALRSIPSYERMHDLIEDTLRRERFPAYSQVWDFGCSTGSGMLAAGRGLADARLEYHGCDISRPMLERAGPRANFATFYEHNLLDGLPPQLREGEVAVAIYGWTLQFLSSYSYRMWLLWETYRALCPGGVMFIFEKFGHRTPIAEDVADNGYIRWRRDNGYSLDEIRAKTLALQSAMFPWPYERLEALLNALPRAEWYWADRAFNFGGVVVRKPRSLS